MKTKESRFQVHDDLTAPERSMPVLKGALAAGGQLSNIVGVLAGAPATLRAYARFRSELRNGTLPAQTQQRIALAVAQHQGSEYALATLQRTAREAGLGIDEVGVVDVLHGPVVARSCSRVKALPAVAAPTYAACRVGVRGRRDSDRSGGLDRAGDDAIASGTSGRGAARTCATTG